MQSNAEKIISRILSDAEKQAAEITADAERRADGISQAAEDAARAKYRENEARLLELGASVSSRRRTVAALEIKKIRLAARREVLAEAFRRAGEKLAALPQKDYLALVSGLLSACAEEGDRVVLAAACPLSDADVSALPVFGEKNLTLAARRGDFAGGVFLEGARYDKSATFETLLEQQRTMEPELDNFLFGD